MDRPFIRDIDELRRVLSAEKIPGTVFVFDLGNVMLTFDNAEHARRMRPYTGADPARVEMMFHASEYHRRFDAGQMEPDAFRQVVKAELGILMREDDFWRLFVERLAPPNPAMLELVTELGLAGHQTAVLSNIDPVALAHLQTVPTLLDLFDIRCFSCVRGVRKPDRAAFQNVVNAAPPGSRFVLTDDLERNVSAAKTLGWTTYRFALPDARIPDP